MQHNNSVNVVIGSWGSYNECNERAGSKWLDLTDYSDWEEIEEELTIQGFKLKGIDEELFIQDIDNFPGDTNWDYVNPKSFFELLKESGILDNEYAFKTMEAYIDVMGADSFLDRVRDKGLNWDDDIYLYPDATWHELGYQFLHDSYGDKLDSISRPFSCQTSSQRFLYFNNVYTVNLFSFGLTVGWLMMFGSWKENLFL